MTDYDNTNRGAIWKNDDRRDGKNDPHFKGSLNVNGVEYWVSAWKRKDDAGAKAPALSFSIKPKEEQQSISQRATAKINTPDSLISSRRSNADMDDEIPF